MRTIIFMLLLTAVVLQGCAGVAAAPVLSAVTAGAEASKQGYTFLDSGRLNFTVEGPVATTEDAVRRAIQRLDLTLRWEEPREKGPDGRTWSLRSDHRHLVLIEVRHLTDAMTKVEVRAGPLGDKATAHVIAAVIREELARPEAVPTP